MHSFAVQDMEHVSFHPPNTPSLRLNKQAAHRGIATPPLRASPPVYYKTPYVSVVLVTSWACPPHARALVYYAKHHAFYHEVSFVPLIVRAHHPPRFRRISTAMIGVRYHNLWTPRLSPAGAHPNDTQEPTFTPQKHEHSNKPCSTLFLFQADHTQAHKPTGTTTLAHKTRTKKSETQKRSGLHKAHKCKKKKKNGYGFALFKRFLLAPPSACCSLGTRRSSTRRTWGTGTAGTGRRRQGGG